jgi:hypothetical protein
LFIARAVRTITVHALEPGVEHRGSQSPGGCNR